MANSASLRFSPVEFEFRRRGDSGALAQQKHWTLAGAGRTFALPRRGRIRVGRAPACDIVLDDPAVAPHHCTLEFTRQGLCLRAQAGAQVSVNDQALRASAPQLLSQGDLIAIGPLEFGLIAMSKEQ